jgi:hypothetical protein
MDIVLACSIFIEASQWLLVLSDGREEKVFEELSFPAFKVLWL